MALETHKATISVSAKDETGAALKSASEKLNAFANAAERTSRSSNRDIQRALGGLTGFQRQIGRAAAAFGGGLLVRRSVTEFAAMDRSLTELRHTLSQTGDQFAGTKQRIFDVANANGQSVDAVLKGWQEVAKATGDPRLAENVIDTVARSATAMGAEITDTAKMASMMMKDMGMSADQAATEINRVTAASNAGKVEGKEVAANFEEIALMADRLGYKGPEGMSKILALLTQVRRGASSTSEAVTNLGDLTSKMVAPETIANFKKFGVNIQEEMRIAKVSGDDGLMRFLKLYKKIEEQQAKKGRPITVEQILQDKQAKTALATLAKYMQDLFATKKEFESAPMDLNTRQFLDKIKDAQSQLQIFENKFVEARNRLGEGIIDAGGLEALRLLGEFLNNAGKGAQLLGQSVKDMREKGFVEGVKPIVNYGNDLAADAQGRHLQHRIDEILKMQNTGKAGSITLTDSHKADLQKELERSQRELYDLQERYSSRSAPQAQGPGAAAPLTPMDLNGPAAPIISDRVRPPIMQEQLDGQRKGNEELRGIRQGIERLHVKPISLRAYEDDNRYGVEGSGGIGGNGGIGGGRGGGRFNGLGGGGGGGSGASGDPSRAGPGHIMPEGEREAYIREAAKKRGIDPDIAMRVAKSEGFGRYSGDKNTSFGDFQLHYKNNIPGLSSAGLGDAFTRETGLDARDPKNTRAAIDFALNKAAKGGWGPWHGWKGASRAGIGPDAREAPINTEPYAPSANANAQPSPNGVTDISGQARYNGGRMNGGVKGFIFHHTGGRGTPEGVVNTLNQRGLGVHYVMDREGNVFQTLPEGAKGAHMRPGQGVGRGLSNENTMGMEVIAKDDRDITPAQIAASKRWAAQMKSRYPGIGIYGHGEVNPHKQHTEGSSIVNAIRRGETPAPTAGVSPAPESSGGQIRGSENPERGASIDVEAARAARAELERPVQLRFETGGLGNMRDRGAAQARRELDRDLRSARYNSYNDVGVA